MDFESNHGGNPFLCDDDFTMPIDNNPALNPFLTDGNYDFGTTNGTAELNPFLSGMQDDFSAQQEPVNTSASTNPFAMFGVEDIVYLPPEKAVEPPTQLFYNEEPAAPLVTLSNNAVTNDNATNLFGEPETAPPQVSTAPFSGPQRPPPPTRPQIPTTITSTFLPTNDISGFGHENSQLSSHMDETSSIKSTGSDVIIPYQHVPPPRPAPPSRETQQLIRTVTGAMDATSSDLLERLQATRTPSPTPMRELHTPSPTPDLMRRENDPENDFLMSDDIRAPPPSANYSPSTTFAYHSPTKNTDIMNLLDGDPDNNNMPVQESSDDVFGLFDSNDIVTARPVVAETRPTPAPPTVTPAPPTPPESPEPPTITPVEPVVTPAPPVVTPAPPVVTPAPPVVTPAPPVVTPAPPVITPAPPVVTPAPVMVTPAPHTAPVAPTITPAHTGTATHPPVMRPPPPRPVPPMKHPIKHPDPTDLMGEIELTKVEEVRSATPEECNANQEIHITPNVHSLTNHPETASTMVTSTRFETVTSVQEQNLFSTSAFTNDEAAPIQTTATSFFNDAQAPADTKLFGSNQDDEFDAFAAKFDNAAQDNSDLNNGGFSDPFSGSGETVISAEAWGAQNGDGSSTKMGFGADDDDAGFDAFLSLREPPPVQPSAPARKTRQESADSEDGSPDFAIVIKPKNENEEQGMMQTSYNEFVPTLAPPPRSPGQNAAYSDNSPRFNPFDGEGNPESVNSASAGLVAAVEPPLALPHQQQQQFVRSDSQETPPTPLFDDDVSQPLEEFPRVRYEGDGWEMHLRQPNKKKITGQRFWKKVFVRLVYQGDNPVLQLFNTKDDKDPFQELPLQPCYSISDIGAQQFDQYGKIFTVKLQYVFYKERPGVRPGQVTKAERITNKLSQFAAYAIQGDYQGVKEFGSDLRKLGLPVEHAPQISQLLKIGSQNYEDMKQFSLTTEEALFRMPAHRDRALHYKMEEVQITAVDELYLEQDKTGHVCRQIARVRIFFLGFISGMPDLELGVNDIMRQGKEVVGRHDIIPVITEEWIRLEQLEFHACVLNHEYEGERVIRFKPPDACYIELLRFRVRPPKNRELPLQTKCTICVTGPKVEIKCDILVPGFSSRKLGQIPCEDIMLRIPIPECWIYLFRIEKHFRYGSVKSAHRRTGKIKGIERFLGTVETMEQHLIEVTSGSAKYEHQHRAIVWRIHRLPKEGQGAYTNHELVCRFQLTSYDQIPAELAQYCYLEFTMPSTQVSHTTVRSLSVCGDRDDDPPEKCVRHLARLEYRIEIDHIQGSGPGEYVSATHIRSAPEPVVEQPGEREKDSDSDSSS